MSSFGKVVSYRTKFFDLDVEKNLVFMVKVKAKDNITANIVLILLRIWFECSAPQIPSDWTTYLVTLFSDCLCVCMFVIFCF